MNAAALRALFDQVRSKKLTPDEAVSRLRHLPFEDLGFAKLDHHRALRQGMPEVIFSDGKTPEQVAKIFTRLAAHNEDANILATRATEEQFQAVQAALADSSSNLGVRTTNQLVIPTEGRNPLSSKARTMPQSPLRSKRHVTRSSKRGITTSTDALTADYRPLARCITLHRDRQLYGKGTIAIVSAGTSDIPVAEEAVVTAELMGNKVQHLYDVGVAGIHRLLAHQSILAKARVIIVCAGMEGALPSVVGGLVGVPVIAVPTSIGYGAAFQGLAALLGMLNSCASNVSVVNIDNGFGAAYVASLINRK
jgi:hypothetical protein